MSKRLTLLALSIAVAGCANVQQTEVAGKAPMAQAVRSASAAMSKVVSIRIELPRSTAEWVEAEVTDRLEQALAALPGLIALRSMSNETLSQVELQYAQEPSEAELHRVTSALADFRKTLPAGANASAVIAAPLLGR